MGMGEGRERDPPTSTRLPSWNLKRKKVPYYYYRGLLSSFILLLFGFYCYNCLTLIAISTSKNHHETSSRLYLYEILRSSITSSMEPPIAVAGRGSDRVVDADHLSASQCSPRPGQDKIVEGGYIGYRLLLHIKETVERLTRTQTQNNNNTPARLLCLIEYPQFHHSDHDNDNDDDISAIREFVHYFSSNCGAVHIFHDSSTIAGHQLLLEPQQQQHPTTTNVHFWSSTSTSTLSPTFWKDCIQSVLSNYDWVVVLPADRYIIFELLQFQLSNLVAAPPTQPQAVTAGLLTNLDKSKLGERKPVLLHHGYVYSRAAVENTQLSMLVSSLPSLVPGKFVSSLWQCLSRRNHSYYLTSSSGVTNKDTPFTVANITGYTTLKQWLRLHSILHHGSNCHAYWDSPLGAQNEHGHWNYIHNETYLRHNPLPFNKHLSNCETKGPWYEATRKALAKVEISPTHPQTKKVFCMVYTHSNRHHQLRAIAETWGPRCDGFMAASNLTDASLGAVNLWHEGPEIYGNMWLKVRSMVCACAHVCELVVNMQCSLLLLVKP